MNVMAEGKTAALYFIETKPCLSARIANQARRFAKHLLDPYRPELHYMRGPGPKWREKHGVAPVPHSQPHIGDLGIPSIWKGA